MSSIQNVAPVGALTCLGIGVEVTSNTAVSPSIYVPFVQAQFDGANALIKRNTARKHKGMAQAGAGTFDVKGSIEIEASPDECGLLLALGLGKDTVTTTGGNSSHLLTMSSPLSTFTASVDYGRNTVFQYVGNKIDKVDFDIKTDAPLTVKFTSIGVNVSPLTNTSLVPTYSNPVSGGMPFDFTMIHSATLGGVAFYPETITVSFSNSLKSYQAAGSGRFPNSINELNATVTGTFSRAYYDDYITSLLWGQNSGPSTSYVGGVPLSFTFTSPSNIGGGTAPNSLTVNMPNVILESAPTDPKLSDVVMQTVKFSAYGSSASIMNPTSVPSDDIQIILVNGNPTPYV